MSKKKAELFEDQQALTDTQFRQLNALQNDAGNYGRYCQGLDDMNLAEVLRIKQRLNGNEARHLAALDKIVDFWGR